MTLICVPIMVENSESTLADAREALHRGADLVEFRVDGLFEGARDDGGAEIAGIVAMVSASPLPCIVTCRPVLEGGQYDGPDDLRISLFERLGTMASESGEHPPRYLDVELLTYTRSENLKQKINLAVAHPSQVRDLSTSLILSTHDFHTRPPDLIRRIEQMFNEPACKVAKVAYRARSLRDNLELLDILQLAREHGKPMIALGMGPYGLMSRVLAPKFNGFLTFASLRRQSATAPGQPIISELVDLYRFRSITASTKVYGVVGDPVEHSLSPQVHNAGFESVGHDGVYLPMPVAAGYESFKATVLSMLDHAYLDLAGLSVTIPHKENLVRLAREMREEGDERWKLDALSERSGAANTLVVHRRGGGEPERLEVHNSDGLAALEGLREARPGFTRLCVLGAGGTARSVAAAALLDGYRVTIANRTVEKARMLADELASTLSLREPPRAVALDEFADGEPDAVINCTSVGMESGADKGRSPVNLEQLGNRASEVVVGDCVYRPLITPLLAQAERLGCGRVDGLSMFVRQAARQFELWTDRPGPAGLFRTVAGEMLAGRV
jgi:3-dehydroquinate dehydratase / shikimate dehydrogenase